MISQRPVIQLILACQYQLQSVTAITRLIDTATIFCKDSITVLEKKKALDNLIFIANESGEGDLASSLVGETYVSVFREQAVIDKIVLEAASYIRMDICNYLFHTSELLSVLNKAIYIKRLEDELALLLNSYKEE